MQEILCNSSIRVQTLTTEEVLDLHKILCENYDLLPEMEPVSPPGIKNKDLLESAVSRQLVGSGDYFKYPDKYSNCATLVFGLVKNHSFHNGNKRIAFLALLKHLYCNGQVIRPNIKHREIYDLLRMLADNALMDHAYEYNKHFYKLNKNSKWIDELQIRYITEWLRCNAEHKNTKIKQKTLALNELIPILIAKNLNAKFSGRYLTVSQKTSILQGIFGKSPLKRDYTIKKQKNISLMTVEQIRKDFSISFLDGVDNSSFYNDEDLLNKEIVSYKKIIYKLAKT